MKDQTPSFIGIFGSGETASTGRKAHEYILSKLKKKQVNIAIVTTPAGFQPNVVSLHEEIVTFFKEHLTNYHPECSIVYANTREQANDKTVIEPLLSADYIFIGPGSPTYAVEHLRDTLLYDQMLKRVRAGASLAIASAAAIAFSAWTLPVYEIYKVGEPLHWVEGLNAYQILLNKKLSIIPHYNNTEGGKKNDTSRCFMGEYRFEQLLNLLPPGEELWGIDEHTGIVVEIGSGEKTVLGKGELHFLQAKRS